MYKNKILNWICLAICFVASCVSIISIIMLFSGQGNPPATEGLLDNWTGTLSGKFLGALGNSDLTSLVCAVGIISCVYLCSVCFVKFKKNFLKVLLAFFIVIALLLNAFVMTLCASTILIVVLLILCFFEFYALCLFSFKKTDENITLCIIKTAACSAFLTLLIWGLLFDLIVAYKALGIF